MLRRTLVVGVAAAVAVTVAVLPADAAPVPPSAAATLGNANPADNTPHAQSGEVRAFAQVGNTIYVGGTFTNIKAAGAAQLDLAPLPVRLRPHHRRHQHTFLPQLDGSVSALAISPDGQKLIVAGSFKNVGGVARKNLVALDLNTGAMNASWTGRGDGGTIRARDRPRQLALRRPARSSSSTAPRTRCSRG